MNSCRELDMEVDKGASALLAVRRWVWADWLPALSYQP